MYEYMKGQVTIITSKYLVIEVDNIGYNITVANPYSFKIDERIVIYLQEIIREDGRELYGFKKIEEKNLFNDLICVKGIGPKSALAILGARTVDEIKNSIINEDVGYLQKFPKIGKKSASQIILDLSGKYSEGDLTQGYSQTANNNEDVIEALVALGYNENNVKKYLQNVDSSLSTEEKIKEVLKMIISN